MPENLDPDYYRREAARLRAKAASESSEAARQETLQIAEQFETLAMEIDRYLREFGNRAGT